MYLPYTVPFDYWNTLEFHVDPARTAQSDTTRPKDQLPTNLTRQTEWKWSTVPDQCLGLSDAPNDFTYGSLIAVRLHVAQHHRDFDNICPHASDKGYEQLLSLHPSFSDKLHA